jgi:monothiol glutaredoxin
MSDQANSTIKQAIETNPVCLFMKGTPDAPQCGFSAQVVQVLNEYGVPFHSVDVLADWDVREGIKSFSNWPTIPQLYVQGKFVGGCDITMQLYRKGELKTILEQVKH